MNDSTEPALYPLVAIVGPTASGKSALAMTLAHRFGGEIINYDSVQVYKWFDIGSAKPTLQERARIPHHLIDLLDPHETFTAGEFARRARVVLQKIRARERLPILVGGTGLYLRALLEGLFEGPQRDEQIRRRLRERAQRNGVPYLHRLLHRWDPPAAARISPQDSHRLIRALEIFLSSRKTQSEFFLEPRQALRGFAVFRIGLNPSRKELYTRINDRVIEMYDRGLATEAGTMLTRGVSPTVKPFQALGYKQVVRHLLGELTLAEALAKTQQATRRYAKRQMTWFRKETGVTWFAGFGNDHPIQQEVLNFLESAANVYGPL
jgi:tRNA dimethylallyltransferase